ncbi:pentatricopeptide repeat-containing protein-like [Dorcoceras hygrometricum]|uniref:Pentatricopeptide repeat-containing protein-like n=1 Tax=Dorcoceras hygrometricum TaxID=472368 RepID=A0A2Z7C3B1_9LAMI|nr:pentatricopeptide repeat-containing protein-like [Dorcoceras hygrometricum]
MRSQFSESDEPLRAPNKKRKMKIEFRLLHDVVVKALCAKVGSFDQSTWDNVSARMNIFDEWMHFRKERELLDLSSQEVSVVNCKARRKLVAGRSSGSQAGQSSGTAGRSPFP